MHGVRSDVGPLRGGACGAARRMADRLPRPNPAEHPGLAGVDHRCAGRAGNPVCQGIRPQRDRIRRTVDDHHGRRNLSLVPQRCHVPLGVGAAHVDRIDGTQRRRVGALRRPGEGASVDRVADDGDGHRLVAAAASGARRVVLVCAHRPMALRRLRRGQACQPGGSRQVRRQAHHGPADLGHGDGLEPVLSTIRSVQSRCRRRGPRRGPRRG
ncbi:Uncharacterised protein [Mycobacterium tuberculosis]|nr:Uncharacterised protein [Mycobacterium tuberculosis]